MPSDIELPEYQKYHAATYAPETQRWVREKQTRSNQVWRLFSPPQDAALIPAVEQNPTEWWESNGDRYKQRNVLAKQHLLIPATSVPAERMGRGTDSEQHVDMLVFLTKNWFWFSDNNYI